MPITPQQARAELARRELARRELARREEEAITPEILSPLETQKRKQAEWDIRHPIAKKVTDYLFPQALTEAKFERGKSNIYGDIFERPGAAIRSALLGKGYTQGALVPEEVPTFQDIALEKYYKNGKPSALKTAGGFGVSAAGMGADILTNPANLLMLLTGGKIAQTGAKELGKAKQLVSGITQKVATSPIGQITQKGLEKTTQVIKTLPSRMPKIMGEKWFEKEAKLAQKTAGGLEKMRGAAYENVYSKLNKAPIEPIKINNILQKYDLIDELGSPHIVNIEEAKAFSDELAQYIPQQIKQGKIFGKGGFANPKIRAEKAAGEIKDLIYQSAQQAEKSGIIEKGATQSLRNLDKLAREKLYPRAEKIRTIGGISPEPETSGVASAYRILRGSEGAAGKRLAIKRTPEALRELKQYITPEKQIDLSQAIKNAEQLAKNMKKYRGRQITKAVTTGGAGLLALWDYLFRRKVAGQILQ